MIRILVVDDDPEVRAIIAQVLTNQKFTPVTVDSSQAAQLAVENGNFDAVLLDLVLGDETGWETLRKLRILSSVPIILMTGAYINEAVKLDAKKLGAQDILPKPFEGRTLIAALSRVLEK